VVYTWIFWTPGLTHIWEACHLVTKYSALQKYKKLIYNNIFSFCRIYYYSSKWYTHHKCFPENFSIEFSPDKLWCNQFSWPLLLRATSTAIRFDAPRSLSWDDRSRPMVGYRCCQGRNYPQRQHSGLSGTVTLKHIWSKSETRVYPQLHSLNPRRSTLLLEVESLFCCFGYRPHS